MARKIVFLMGCVSEWIVFGFVLLYVLTFNMVHLGNILFVDMSWEQPATVTSSSFIQPILLVLGMGLVCFFYINYFDGEGLYKRFKEVIWGTLFGLNSLGCIVYFLMGDGFTLPKNELIFLIVVTVVSVLLTMQIMTKPNNR
ncbi:hypothetical protein AAGS61_10385 [Lysinibacillus sp. KU-BSD001]|uniref:hypothetical protein n=1 Tax=Lysinibacillus sp. KU-BSD001 TaxID=3141328 RepID=UPI0036EB009B